MLLLMLKELTGKKIRQPWELFIFNDNAFCCMVIHPANKLNYGECMRTANKSTCLDHLTKIFGLD